MRSVHGRTSGWVMLLLINLLILSRPAGAGPDTVPKSVQTIDVSAAGTPFSPMVRGLAMSDSPIDSRAYEQGFPDTVKLSEGSSLRGVAGGLRADWYDWKVRNNEARPSTLEFQRYARDKNSLLFVTANTRGLVVPDPGEAGKYLFYTTDITTLANLAADWVRYTNRICINYRQGDTINDPRDIQILNSLVWSSGETGDSFDKLLPPAEASVFPVLYWEVGNEPTVSLQSSSAVSNGFALTPAQYQQRYVAIAGKMKQEDSQIKVGPCVIDGTSSRGGTHLTAILNDVTAPVDFISYHPYQRLADYDTPAAITSYLNGIYGFQSNSAAIIRTLITNSGRSASAIKLVASEVNVSDWSVNETLKEGQMAHALGSVETVFSHARLDLLASHYWIWIAHPRDGTKYPVTLAWEKLREWMGDRMVHVSIPETDLRMYATRNSQTGNSAIWLMNFSNTVTSTVTLNLQGLPNGAKLTQHRLQATTQTTTLFSANVSKFTDGGPLEEVDWIKTDRSDESVVNLPLGAPAATLTLLVVKPNAPSRVDDALKY